jgi:hypothetical protein
MKIFKKFFSSSGNTSAKPPVSSAEKLAHYELARSIAQDAVDAAEKWADIQHKVSGRKPMSVDKYTKAAAHLIFSSSSFGVELSPQQANLLIDAALGATLSREIPGPSLKFGFEEGPPDNPDYL